MKKIIASLVVISVAALLISCSQKSSSSADSPIVGKWQQMGGDSGIFEFFKDGTVRAISGTISASGKYSFLETDRMKIELSGVGVGVPPGPLLVRVSMSGDDLSLTDEKGEVSKYKR